MTLDVHGLVSLGRVASLAVSPDGRHAVCAVMRLDEETKPPSKYVSDLWRVPLDGDPAVRLTRGPHDDRSPCFRRDGALGFISNRAIKGQGLESPARKTRTTKSAIRFGFWARLPSLGP